MALDWGLASVHHQAIFTLAAILAFELALTSGELDGRTTMDGIRANRAAIASARAKP